MSISYSASQPGPAYEFGVWLREHSGEILEVLQSPKVWLLVVVGIFVVLLILAGVIRAAARAYYFLRLLLEIRAGAITVGYRRTRPLDVLLDPPLRLSFPDRCMHTQVVAPTRQGKTSLMSSWLYQDLAEGHTVMVNEMMGDLGDKACEAARDVGASIGDFDPTSDDTLKWNPLYAGSWLELESVAEQVVAAFRGRGGQHQPLLSHCKSCRLAAHDLRWMGFRYLSWLSAGLFVSKALFRRRRVPSVCVADRPRWRRTSES